MNSWLLRRHSDLSGRRFSRLDPLSLAERAELAAVRALLTFSAQWSLFWQEFRRPTS